MIHNAACRRAAAPTDELIAAIRGMVGSRKRNVGVSRLETLTDILVHGQDIAIPLGRHLPTRTDAAAAAASGAGRSGRGGGLPASGSSPPTRSGWPAKVATSKVGSKPSCCC